VQSKSLKDINRRIKEGNAVILTAEEISKMVREGEEPGIDEVDVITTGTCGIMSGTAAILHFNVSEPKKFRKAKTVLLNGIPAFPGPCPNEWLGSLDLIVYGTAYSIYDEDYGGGFLFKDLVSGEDIDVEIESFDNKNIESTINIEDMSTAKMIGIRWAFKNYSAFINPTDRPVSSIFHAIKMDGPFIGLSFSGCGELNPLENDPKRKTLVSGTRVLLNGVEGFLLGSGTRSSQEKPNMMVLGDMQEMDAHYLGGFRTAAGPEIFNSLAAAIPITNEEILKYTFIKNEDIPLPIVDINGRNVILSYTNYGAAWNDYDERPAYHPEKCLDCDNCVVRRRCPTKAFTTTLNTLKCVGCGMCAYSCENGVFTMNIGSLEFEINNEVIKTPIVCRQSDRKRGREIALELKKKIKTGDFSLSKF
jgi:L-aspartate semialdehyde sulfurtransferase